MRINATKSGKKQRGRERARIRKKTYDKKHFQLYLSVKFSHFFCHCMNYCSFVRRFNTKTHIVRWMREMGNLLKSLLIASALALPPIHTTHCIRKCIYRTIHRSRWLNRHKKNLFILKWKKMWQHHEQYQRNNFIIWFDIRVQCSQM